MLKVLLNKIKIGIDYCLRLTAPLTDTHTTDMSDSERQEDLEEPLQSTQPQNTEVVEQVFSLFKGFLNTQLEAKRQTVGQYIKNRKRSKSIQV